MMLESSRLLRPLNFLRIKFTNKNRYCFLLPILFSIAFTFILALNPNQIAIFGDNGFLKMASGILQLLTGFFIASLAAVASFNKGELDEYMSGNCPTLQAKENGSTEPRKLTRRRFLCYLFGYLSFTSLMLYLIGLFCSLFYSLACSIIPDQLHRIVLYTFTLFYSFVFFNLITTTLLGLFFTADRIHWEGEARRLPQGANDEQSQPSPRQP
ncbi:hypothetical protein BerOc1_00697 [Pseudodesulfovibrio hydrargyri]|uniref:Uncharacterized protein n=1 Tax=Pseudodesulfovibrio hydrargyri TaxID=2125990 RepID=A0A1J5NG82_9BACT|nr:hypothetical protein [Pseudodesulfovibrio hydrargyri]OIQ52223.1 hypothetical protein BerOc1_00697 [Pseudodesulfovibrio hydrargyri]